MKHDFPGLLNERTKAGTTRWRVRVEGEPNRKIKIPMGPGEPGFDEHYHAARLGQTVEVRKPARPRDGTLDELCDRYIEWFEKLVVDGKKSKLTLDNRRRALRQACDVRDEYGDRMGSLDADMPRAAFIDIRDSFGGRSGAADTCFKSLRVAYAWGEDHGFPENSPVFRVKSGYEYGGGATAWTPGEITKFLQRHGPGTMARLWLALAYATAGRIGDARHLGPVNETWIDGVRHLDWQPRKKGSKPVCVPMEELLKIELENHDLNRETYLITDLGEPFASSGALDNKVRDWIVQAGLTDANGKANRSQHGVRKGVAEMLAENGATTYEIMSVLGHSDPRTSEIYTKKAERKRLARSAAAKREAIQMPVEDGKALPAKGVLPGRSGQSR